MQPGIVDPRPGAYPPRPELTRVRPVTDPRRGQGSSRSLFEEAARPGVPSTGRPESGAAEPVLVYDRRGQMAPADAGARAEARSGGQESEEAVHGPAPEQDLTEAEARELQELKQADREVRTHEQAHMAAGGDLVRRGARFEYQRGPDGRNYAVGGEVSVDTSEGKSPEETLRKMSRVKAAAMAPAEPSPQDRRVAAQADAKAAQARRELQQEAGKASRETREDAAGRPSSVAGQGPDRGLPPLRSSMEAYRQAQDAFSPAEPQAGPRLSATA